MSDPFKPDIEDKIQIKLSAPQADTITSTAVEATPAATVTSTAPAATVTSTAVEATPAAAVTAVVKNAGANINHHSPIIPKRKKQRPPIVVLILLGICCAPLIVAAANTLIDPAGLDFFKARVLDVGNDAAAIADYSNALKKRLSMPTLQVRSDLYKKVGNKKEQAKDLQTLIDNNVQNGCNWADLASIKMRTEGESAETQNLLEKAFKLTLYHSKSPLASMLPDTHDLYNYNPVFSCLVSLALSQNDKFEGLAWDLVACGRPQTVIDELKAQGEWDKRDNTLLRALALREINQDDKSRAILTNTESLVDPVNWRWPNYIIFEALSALDHSDTATAAKWVKLGWSEGWSNSLPAAWLSFKQGKYTQALKMSDGFSKYAEAPDGNETIMERQQVGANHLLRAHIFLKLKMTAQAADEFAKYRKQGSNGTMFIPKIYRGWLTEKAQ